MRAIARRRLGAFVTIALTAVAALDRLHAQGPGVTLDPTVVGQWAGPFDWPLVSVHSTLMPDGRVLLWDDHTTDAGVQIWDPINDTLTNRPYYSADLFCAGHTLLPDGRVFVIGGHVNAYIGIQNSTIFNPFTQVWTDGPLMSQPRWYPTATALPNGKVLAMSGASNCPTCNSPTGSHAGIALIPEVYDPVANAWSRLTSASLSLPLYPHMHVIPDGRLLVTGSQEEAVATKALDINAQSWTTIDSNVKDGGSSVMYRPGKILKTGTGRNPDYPAANAAATAYVIDMNQPSPSWRAVTPMTDGRTQHNLTMLPDGNVLLVGGATTSDVNATSAAVEYAALWSPDTETWTPLASLSEPRLYHSTSLLLPDGRVLVSGGGRFGPSFPSAEIFSPPYLFQGARPVITSAPSLVQYGSHITIGTPDAGRIAKVTLLRLGSVTHAFDENQRYVEMNFAQAAGGLDVTVPSNPNIAPPGYYMIFLVDTAGIPSVSTMVRFPAPWEESIPPSAPGTLSASAVTGKVSLNWGPATDNSGVTQYNVHRATASGVTPDSGDRVGQTQATTFADTGFESGTYYYVVTAQDAVGNIGPPSNEVSLTVTADTSAPAVTLTAPGDGALVSDVVAMTATASDDVGVAGVQFFVDGAPLGAESPTPPFTVSWDTTTFPNGSHTVAALARDARGNQTTSTVATVTVSNDFTPGLVAAYSFNEGAGSLALDSSGHKNRGTITNATWTAAGHTGSALSFDGTSDYVRAASSPSLNVSGTALTIEMWANITGGSQADYVLLAKPWIAGFQANPPYQFGVEFDANGAQTLDFYLGDTDGISHGPYSMTPALATWTHLAFTFDGAAVRGYLNGTLKFQTALAASIQARPTDLLIGVDGLFGQGFKGKLDDVRIYNRVLSQTEIQSDMGHGVSPAVPPVPDGTFGTAMSASRGNTAGTEIDLTWDTSTCVGKGAHIVYGALSSLPTYQVAGGVCAIGSSGSYAWTTAPASDSWFVVVADDQGVTEGSWGLRSDDTPMSGGVASGVCGMTTRVNLSACP